jgi:hypothetical protein
MEGSLVAYKVFTNGSVLNASEINDNLMNQSVIVFSNSTARGSAISSPIEGMVTYLEDTDALEVYKGASWEEVGAASDFGKITTQTFTDVSSVSLNDVFSSTYDYYEVNFSMVGSTTAQPLITRLRVSGADNTSSIYSTATFTGNTDNASFFFSQGSFTTSIPMGAVETAGPCQGRIALFNPFATQITGWEGGAGWKTGSEARNRQFTGQSSVTTSFTGISFIPSSGNITGSVSVYGLAK